VPRYLSPEWVQAFNAALAPVDLTEAIAAAGTGSLTASQGAFAVAQVVTGVPEGVAAPTDSGASTDTVRTVLVVRHGGAALVVDPEESLPANVTIVVGYPDALAIARGQLDPADALAAGRVRVRGELAVLVAGQQVLGAASVALGPVLDALTE
jgi:hypothetical protein